MTAKIISGTQVAAEIREELKIRINKCKEKGVTPSLAVVLVGEDPASISYVTAKAKGAEEIGMHEETMRLPADTPEEKVLQIVDKLNKDPKFHGILVQLPLPKHIDTDKIINYISPEKDVDGFHPGERGQIAPRRTLPPALHAAWSTADAGQKRLRS